MSGIVLGVAGLVSFAVAALLGKVLIPWLRRLKFGQTILEDGPTWHQQKQGTPTMGGMLFIGGFVVAALITPPDIFSQVMVALPILLLYQVSIWLSAVVGRMQKGKKEEA
jgi:phospho-N-acetylmuramoyl-pentapeptide-transferase